MKPKLSKTFKKVIVPVAIITVAGLAFWLAYPSRNTTANFTSAKATMSNSRLSYQANVTSGTVGESVITIDGSSAPDNDTDHLFPDDLICFTQNGTPTGCRDDIDYNVVNTPTSATFVISPVLGTTLQSDDWAVATQSGTIAIDITLGNDIPSDGDILITIPMADNIDGNDYFPDEANTESVGGFDLGGITTSNVSVSETCGGTFTVQAVNEGSGTTDHTIEINNSVGACATSSTLTITVGDGSKKLINPPPKVSAHTQGAADVYSINVKTRGGTNETIDEADVLVAPVEAVLISATVDETMSFRVCGVKTDLSTQESACFSTPATVCNLATLSVSSYAYSVPFGTLSVADSFNNAAQYMTVGTNADSGYAVTIQQNDQMGKDGGVCTGNPTDPVASNCIPDNPGDTNLDYAFSDDCDTPATNGLCFSTDTNSGGTDPTFAVKWNVQTNDCDGSPTFCARSAADQENGPETPSTIINYGNPVSASDAFICWRLSIDAIQPAGYYFNKVKYIATPIF
jgi:hypothetical protein